MREIRFRVWDKESHKYYLLYEVRLDLTEDLTAHNNNIILMQYTGLKDKNGVEIYEGDIVQWHYGNNTEQRVVEWVVGEAMFKPNDLDQDPPVEVIGNIHKNPELI